MSYYYQLNGKKYGPLPLEDLVKIISLDDLVSVSGSEEWVKANEIPEVLAKFNEHNPPKKVTPPPLPTTMPQASKVPPPIPKSTVIAVPPTIPSSKVSEAPPQPPRRTFETQQPNSNSYKNNIAMKPKIKSKLMLALLVGLITLGAIYLLTNLGNNHNKYSQEDKEVIKGEDEKPSTQKENNTNSSSTNSQTEKLETVVDNNFPIQAYIEDKDGYTNVRSEPTAKSEILTTVKEGEMFYTALNYGLNEYWKVKTKTGVIGYMHQSRIRSDDIAYEKYMKSLITQEDANNNTASTSETNETGKNLADAIGGLLGLSGGHKKNHSNERATCKWCGNEFKYENGWFHNSFYAQGNFECMQVSSSQYASSADYCSRRCCEKAEEKDNEK